MNVGVQKLHCKYAQPILGVNYYLNECWGSETMKKQVWRNSFMNYYLNECWGSVFRCFKLIKNGKNKIEIDSNCICFVEKLILLVRFWVNIMIFGNV